MAGWKKNSKKLWRFLRSLAHNFNLFLAHIAFLAACLFCMRWIALQFRAGHHRSWLLWLWPGALHVVDLITIVLAVSAILYSILQDIGSRNMAAYHRSRFDALKIAEQRILNQVGQLDDHTRTLQRIADSLSTADMEAFPHFLPGLCKLFAGSDRLDIVIDCVDYGSFFSPAVHYSFHQELLRIASRRGLRMLVCGQIPLAMTLSRPTLSYHDSQLGDYLDYIRGEKSDFAMFAKRLASKPRYMQDMRKIFFDDWTEEEMSLRTATALAWITGSEPAASMTPDGKEREDVCEVVQQIRQIWFGIALFQGQAEIAASSKMEQTYFWLRDSSGEPVDDHRLVFTFALAVRGEENFAVRTSNTKIIRTFRRLFNEKWQRAKDDEDGETGPVWVSFVKRCKDRLMDGLSTGTLS